MTWLYEDPWPIVWIALPLLAMLGVGYYHSRHRGVLAAILTTLALSAAALVIERTVVTEREEIEQTLDAAALAVKQNDLPAVLAFIAPEALAMRSTVQAMLPTLDVADAKVTGNLQIEINSAGKERRATASFIGRLTVNRPKAEGVFLHDNYVRPFTVQLRKEGNRWVMTSFSTDRLPNRTESF
ncbi:MAG: hypothetical protein AB7O62_09365 [Pirellulales bacterium]